MKTNLMLATLLLAGEAMAQIVVSDGTRIRVRLEENVSSENAELGQTVYFTVNREVRIGNNLLVANGAAATGTIVEVEPSRRMGRAGKLDFSIDRVQTVDGNWVSVRYTMQKVHGKGNGMKTGVITAGLAVFFWPAAPLGLLVKGHNAVITRGRVYEVYADTGAYVPAAVSANTPMIAQPADLNAAPSPAPVQMASASSAVLSINANQLGADIEVDGNFVGNAPTTIQIAGGLHRVTVRQGDNLWQRDIQITGGNVTINAMLGAAAIAPVQTASR